VKETMPANLDNETLLAVWFHAQKWAEKKLLEDHGTVEAADARVAQAEKAVGEVLKSFSEAERYAALSNLFLTGLENVKIVGHC
jgi:hypothetical protein